MQGTDGQLNNSGSVNSDQSPEDQAAVKMVLKLYQLSAQSKKNKELVWRDNWQFFLGRQWPQARPKYRSSEVFNYTFAAIESALPILTDQRPRFSFLPEDMGDMEFAEYLEKLLDSDWARKSWQNVVQETFLIGALFGTAVPYMKWDPSLNSGTGDITFGVLEPFYAFPAPWAIDVQHPSCSYFIEARPVPVSKVRAQFPEYAHCIKPDLSTSMPGKYRDEGIEFSDSARLVNYPLAKNDGDFAYATKQGAQGSEMVMVYDCWIDDDSLSESDIQVEQTDGTMPETGAGIDAQAKSQEKKYPDGRHIIVASGYKLHDDNNEYKDGKYPYARYVDHLLPGEFFGMGDLDFLKSPQRVINRTISHAMDNITTMGNPIWVADIGAVDADNLTNAPGLIVEKKQGMELRREPGLPLPASVNNLYQQSVDAFDRIFGMSENSYSGQNPTGVTSGDQYEQITEASQNRLRLKARNMEVCLQQLGYMYIARIFQFWSGERFFAIVQDGAPPEVFRFQIEKEPEFSGWYLATVQQMGYDAGQLVPTSEQKRFKTKGIFDVKASIGSSLPFAKKAKAERGIQLFQLGVIDAEELLKAIDWPDREKIVARMQEQQALKAQQQPQASQSMKQ